MKISVLERLLHAERHRRKMAETVGVFVPPVATRFETSLDQSPWVTSLSKGNFSLAVRSKEDGTVGQAFVDCPIESEGRLLLELYQTLKTLHGLFKWQNFCPTLAEAKARMVSSGFEPKTLIVPFDTLNEIAGSNLTEAEAEMLTMTQGCVAEIGGVKVFSAGQVLPKGSAILGTAPSLVGVYTRIYDHVALTLQQADRTVVLVGDEVA